MLFNVLVPFHLFKHVFLHITSSVLIKVFVLHLNAGASSPSSVKCCFFFVFAVSKPADFFFKTFHSFPRFDVLPYIASLPLIKSFPLCAKVSNVFFSLPPTLSNAKAFLLCQAFFLIFVFHISPHIMCDDTCQFQLTFLLFFFYL